ncbi:MauE/DoxX family redox-associated membrane protein [Bacillus sp. CH30_1T]|uniref:MauE/DoxX family redox-associated membrane protein n=1 Tax=Bacillus sp. CH30_1T TaxID=2604836 RepID=UPI0037BED770
MLISILLVSSISKFVSIKSFKKTVFQLFPNRINSVVSILVPSIEIAIALCLFSSKLLIFGVFGLYVLLTIFLVVVVKNKDIKNIKCNCFGTLTDSVLGNKTLVHIFFLVLLNTFLLFSENHVALIGTSAMYLVSLFSLCIGIVFIYILSISLYSYIKALNDVRH